MEEIFKIIDTIKTAEINLKTLIKERNKIDNMLKELKTRQNRFLLQVETSSGSIQSIELNDKNMLELVLHMMEVITEQDIQVTTQQINQLLNNDLLTNKEK